MVLTQLEGLACKAVKRNLSRFPADFSFVLEDQKVGALRSQIATSNVEGRGGRRYNPPVFTELGAIKAAMVLNCARALQTSVYVVRGFVELRQLAASNAATSYRREGSSDVEEEVSILGALLRSKFVLLRMRPTNQRMQGGPKYSLVAFMEDRHAVSHQID